LHHCVILALRIAVTNTAGDPSISRRRENDTEDLQLNDTALAERFEANRSHLRAVAYRMLGSVSEADDAVQETWIRLSRTDTSDVDNLQAWLTTVVGRVCLDMLRSRKSRREEPFGPHLPEPIVSREDDADPEHEALLADAVGLAMFVVLETLSPAERLAFVLHDMFAVPFEEIARITERTPEAARQLASRARRHVRGSPAPDVDLAEQRRMVDAFLAAARDGDFEALVELLDPDIVLRVDAGAGRPATREIVGAREVARQASAFAGGARFAKPALVNGVAGVVVARGGVPRAVGAVTVAGGRIVAIDVLSDRARLREIDLTEFEQD
jgi:RNA polymerase sigma-70 factor (ECF subfamily)